MHKDNDLKSSTFSVSYIQSPLNIHIYTLNLHSIDAHDMVRQSKYIIHPLQYLFNCRPYKQMDKYTALISTHILMVYMKSHMDIVTT